MSADSAVLAGRQLSERNMTSSCTIHRRTGFTVNPSTGVETPTWSVIYTGKCRLRYPFVRPQQALADGQQLARQRGILSLPIVGSESVQTDDVATIDVNPLDSGVIGQTFRVEGPFTETHATSRRLAVEAVT